MMANWQLDAMRQAENARIWESLNAPDPNENEYLEADKDTEVALRHLRNAIDWLCQAADEVHGLPREDKILALVSALEDIGISANGLKDER